MPFHEKLLAATEHERRELLDLPLVRAGAAGQVTREMYVAFLTEAYHHVKHTVPLLMACGSRLPERYEWLRAAVAEYIEEEVGHQEWILNDIQACGADKEAVRNGEPGLTTELMVAYAYDAVTRINPLAMFGMVLVLEGTSVELASRAGASIRSRLGLGHEAFTYLASHGALDVDHADFYVTLMNRIDNAADQTAVIHSAKVFYKLYGGIFQELAMRFPPILEEVA